MRTDNQVIERKSRTQITLQKIETFLVIIEQEKTQVEMCRILKISKSALRKMIKRYHSGDFDDLRNFKTTEQLKKGAKKNYEIENCAVQMELEVNPCTTLQSLSLNINNNNDINLSTSSIHRRIKMLQYTRKILTKIPINRNSDVNKTLRVEYANFISTIPNNKIVFLDESGFNLYLTPKYGYSPKNVKACITVPNSKGKNVSFLCAISIEGIYMTKTIKGSFKSADLILFINNDLPLLDHNNKKYIIMDNASIHKTIDVKQAFMNRGYILKFIPPYSPHLNPIEEFFSCFKSKFARGERCVTISDIISLINRIIDNEHFNMTGYFEHMREWLDKALARHDFL
ncbi:hypothetical protein DMUE_4295 [Dictyocoela muelleri]|nr:hypothetical protein DMUE_4295 [Dictyocoela muelleri]